jgi:DNA-binding transcriptional LysR family regulator
MLQRQERRMNAPPEGIVREPLWEDEFVVYASVRHPLARRKAVALAALVQERWAATAASAILARQSLRRTFEENGLPAPQIALMSDSESMNARLVASSDLLGVATRRGMEQSADSLGLKIIPVSDVKWIRPVALMYRKDGYLSPVARRFIEILKAMAKEIAAKKR